MIIFPTLEIPATNQLDIRATCVFCKAKDNLIVDKEDYNRWRGTDGNGGEFVQIVFPEMHADSREFFFISGVCPSCYYAL